MSITFETTTLGQLSFGDTFVLNMEELPLDGSAVDGNKFHSFAYDGIAMISNTNDPASRAYRVGITKKTVVIKYTENKDFRGLI